MTARPIDLRPYWLALFPAPTQTQQQELLNLCEHYSEPHRHYHNLDHIRYLHQLAEVNKAQLTDPVTVSLAIWYHDVIYDPLRPDNEEQSARLAEQRLPELGFGPERVEKVARYILATKSHDLGEATNDADLAFFLDADMAILAAPEAAYDAYAAAIRKEYSIYPDELYLPGRKKVLHLFLEKPRIFLTPLFHSGGEDIARKNIMREIEN